MASVTILDETSEYIFGLFKEKLSHDFVYHNYQHTLETVDVAIKLGAVYQLGEEDMLILQLAAWFHDTGYIYQYKGHEELSKDVAREFLLKRNFSADFVSEVVACINATKRDVKPVKLIHQIMCDADIIQIGEESFFLKSELLKAEWENLNIRHCDNLEWEKSQLGFLISANFHTHAAQKLYGLRHQLNIQHQRVKLQKLQKKNEKKKKDAKKSKAQPKRGIETMFRNLYRGHISLSSIADSKANMMINIHSLIISITLTLVGAKFSIFGTSFKQNQIIIYPIISLLLTSLFSIIFAILSAKPKVTSRITSIAELKDNNASILFFGNYTRVNITEFEEELTTLMKSEDDLYGNMVKDLYYLGKVLRKKYRLLRISYTVFMYGLIITVLVAIFVVIYMKHADDYWPARPSTQKLMNFLS